MLAEVDGSSGASKPMPGAMLMIPTGHPEGLELVLYSLIMKASLAPRHVVANLWLLQLIYAYFLCLIETLTLVPLMVSLVLLSLHPLQYGQTVSACTTGGTGW